MDSEALNSFLKHFIFWLLAGLIEIRIGYLIKYKGKLHLIPSYSHNSKHKKKLNRDMGINTMLFGLACILFGIPISITVDSLLQLIWVGLFIVAVTPLVLRA